jgi:hypothetical protein
VVANVIDGLAPNKQAAKTFDVEIFNMKKTNEL